MPATKQQNSIPALSKSISVLKAIAGGMQNYSIAELAREVGVAHTTCYRIVQTLVDADWLRPRTGGVGYELSYGLLPMVEPFLNHRVLIDTISPVVEQLVQKTGLSAKLSVRQGDDAVTVYRVESPQPMSLSGRVGVRFSLAYGSSGACLLSALTDTRIERILSEVSDDTWKRQKPSDVRQRVASAREQRYCTDLGCFHPQVHTISSPLYDEHGKMLAALTILGLPEDMNAKALDDRRKALLKAATQCNQLIKRDELTVELK
ncbi:MAG TPA: hypothetical protein DCM28_22090 [Phycisphaerales bacterium]|nr:hypothetical protein [Phycisphaerales bacterium]HCD33013.1 hypothetical protein [Phycisphaerales bacterium]|tara:strand:- start:74398 stop:75183 length:786 start_codon:yes stop_codon:yes gene_type:complete